MPIGECSRYRREPTIADTDGDGAGKTTNERAKWEFFELLGYLARRHTASTGTRHISGRRVWAAVHKAVNVLEETDHAIALCGRDNRAGQCASDRTVRRTAPISG